MTSKLQFEILEYFVVIVKEKFIGFGAKVSAV